MVPVKYVSIHHKPETWYIQYSCIEIMMVMVLSTAFVIETPSQFLCGHVQDAGYSCMDAYYCNNSRLNYNPELGEGCSKFT